jgi:hypothetical protein
VKIGYSEDFAVCKGVSNAVKGISQFNDNKQCGHFLNKSIDKMCEKHKIMLNDFQMQRFKSARLGTLSDNLDLNKIRK